MIVSSDEQLFRSVAIMGLEECPSFTPIKIFKVVRGMPHGRIDEAIDSLEKNETSSTSPDEL